MSKIIAGILLIITVCSLAGYQGTSGTSEARLRDPFAEGWMLSDTNGDAIIDAIAGKVVVPARSSAAENTAAANVAARLGYASTGLTPPLVIAAAEDRNDGPRIWIGRGALPGRLAAEADQQLARLEANEGGVFLVGGGLLVAGKDEAGLLAAAEALAGRWPNIWKTPGERLEAVEQAIGPGAALTGVTYVKGKIGARRVVLTTPAAPTRGALQSALATPKLAMVHELISISGGTAVSAVNSKEMASIPAAPAEAAAPAAGGGAPPEDSGTPQRLDLATLYTMRGLFKGTPKMPIPSNLDGHLYVPEGAAGVAMANLAARMGLETTGITFPIASPAPGATVKAVKSKAVLAGGGELVNEAEKKLREENVVAGESAGALAPGEGELRVVDKAFGRNSAVLVRGDEAGAAAALGVLSEHFPNVWETGKQYASVEELRYDLHRFFGLRSSAGQAALGMYRLGRWIAEIKAAGGSVKDVEAKMFVEVAAPGLTAMLSKQVREGLGAADAKVEVGSLRAGTKCCSALPALHYKEPGRAFEKSEPTIAEDLKIPWEGTRLLAAVERTLPQVKRGKPVKVLASVSEGPAQRLELQKKIVSMLERKGAKDVSVTVLCAYKPGLSWLMDQVAPQLKSKAVASLKIEFKKNVDPTNMRAMYSPARWVHELYPVDEMLAKELSLPLEKIAFEQFEASEKDPTYRVHALDAKGEELLTAEYSVPTVVRPYTALAPNYEQVMVDTGWVRVEAASKVVLDERIKTDMEEFWDHYQDKMLPKVFQYIMAQARGEVRPEFSPLFDTLRMDIRMSEPDYNIGVDKERISSLEALQEDTFYTTENFVNMIGHVQAQRPVTYVGRIIPVVHPSTDGQDGAVRIEFHAKAAANPMVELKWTDAQGKRQERRRDIFAMGGAMQPRLVGARVKSGTEGIERLTWMLDADFKDDQSEQWAKVEGQEQIERSVFAVEQAVSQIRWLEKMQAAGMYKDTLASAKVKEMALEFDLPRPLTAKVESAAPREYAVWKIPAPSSTRPMISEFAKPMGGSEIVQWDEPIDSEENAAVLAKLATYPGVNVYWMGRSYLGENIWAADFMLPSPSRLRSPAKETTMKASIIYSGRQHANEVSSTSHILKLGEQLVTDPGTREVLKKINVILHPITNPDGTELSVQLAKITPDNMLHPGYHGALAADVSAGQGDTDPVYPESRTRKQLLEAWLPDVFLNPHGYPSHEWVQPFSEYSGWVMNRHSANNGRTWWIPRGWFTSLNYFRDPGQPYSQKVAYEIQDRIVEAMRGVPGLLDLENRMNSRYERFGQRWQPKNMQQPIVKGVRIYMSLKGAPARAPGEGAAGRGMPGLSPDITWHSGYTEAPDETAHGEYMKLMAGAGLAFDRAHLTYLSSGKPRIFHSQKEQAGKVTWRVERLRPNLPSGESEPRREPPAAVTETAAAGN